MITQPTLAAIYGRATLYDVASRYMRLVKRGANYEGHCPFGHDDKTPSFKINPVKGIFKCFSCGEGGNVVRFVMLMEHCTWIEAMRKLADFYTIPIEEVANSPEEAARFAARKQQLAEQETLALQYEACLLKPKDTPLEQHPPYQYLMSRGITLDTIKAFNLGYGGDQGLYHHRVTFAIRNERGECVGFAGRVFSVDSSSPTNTPSKYINSAETQLYKKSYLLYGLYQAKQSLHSHQTGYLVEGYTDVLAMHQHGLTNTVASCGTALTTQQVALLKRFTPHITILFDGDQAGQEATIRAIKLLLQGGLLVDVVHLPGGQDPAEYLAALAASSDTSDCAYSEAPAAIAALRKDFLTYLLDTIPDGANVPTRVAVHKGILKTISGIPDPSLRNEYFKEFGFHIGRNLDEIMQEAESLIGQNVQKHSSYAKNASSNTKTQKKHKTTPDGSHYLVEYAGAYPVSFEIPIPIDWAKHWCEIDKRFNSRTVSVREWLSLESDLICTLVLHGDIMLELEDRQLTLRQNVQELFTAYNLRLQIPILDKMLYDNESPIVDGYDYTQDLFRIRTEILSDYALWEENRKGLPQEEIDAVAMMKGLMDGYEKRKSHLEKVLKMMDAVEGNSSPA